MSGWKERACHEGRRLRVKLRRGILLGGLYHATARATFLDTYFLESLDDDHRPQGPASEQLATLFDELRSDRLS